MSIISIFNYLSPCLHKSKAEQTSRTTKDEHGKSKISCLPPAQAYTKRRSLSWTFPLLSLVLGAMIILVLNSCIIQLMKTQDEDSDSDTKNDDTKATIADPCTVEYISPVLYGDVYLIENWRQLIAIGNVNSSINPDALSLDAQYRLQADILFPNDQCGELRAQITRIGTKDRPFTGTFDGNYKSIAGFIVDDQELDFVGLFAALGTNDIASTIKNLSLKDTIVRARAVAGSLTGYLANGSITNVHSVGASSVTTQGTFSSLDDGLLKGGYTGGLVGIANGEVSGSSSALVVATGSSLGGLVGYSSNKVVGYATGHVLGDISSSNNAGGLVGWGTRSSDIIGYATGNVEGDQNVGGLVGYVQHKVFGYATGKIHGSYSVGGLVGYMRSINELLVAAVGYSVTDTISAEGLGGGLIGNAEGNGTIIGYARSELHRLKESRQTSFGKVIGSTSKVSGSTLVPIIAAHYSRIESSILDENNATLTKITGDGNGVDEHTGTLKSELLEEDLWYKSYSSRWPALVFPTELDNFPDSQSNLDKQPITE